MKTDLTIKNFRIFDEEGVTFDLNPITILTGANSSGKSSMVKAVFLLNSFLSQIKADLDKGEEVRLDKYKLDFSTYPNNLLGRFDKVVHNGSKSKTVTFEYTVYSLMLSKDVTVQLVFSADENDELNNAYLESITMSTDEGVFYYAGKEKSPYCNLNIVKEDFITFLLTEDGVHRYCGDLAETEEGKISEEEFKEREKAITDYLNNINENRKKDIINYVRICKRDKSIIQEIGVDSNTITQLQGNSSIFCIPLIEKLASLTKAEVKDFVTSEFLNDTTEDVVFASNKVIDAFLASDFDSFADFFMDFEERSFSRACDENMFERLKKGVYLVKSYNLSIRENNLRYNFSKIFGNNEEPFIYFHAELPFKHDEASIEYWENRELTFDLLYDVVMEWSIQIAEQKTHKDKESSNGNTQYVYYQPSYILLTKFTETLLQEVLCPDWCGNMSYVSSARADVRRLYSLANKDDFSQLLRNYFEKKRMYLVYHKKKKIQINNLFDEIINAHKRDYEEDSFINKWLEKFEISKAISFNVDQEGLGVQIRLHEEKGDQGRILADEGYGITQLVSILIQIETAILSAQGERVNRYWGLEKFDNYDFQQFHYEINTIAIEEPEIHLHPKYQSLLADMFLEAYEKYNIHFIIETHSEYLIRKTQLLAAKIVPIETDTLAPIYYEKGVESISIFYVDPKHIEQSAKRINICADGYLDDSFGEGFYDEATRLSRRLTSD